jgi:hypothetical protein
LALVMAFADGAESCVPVENNSALCPFWVTSDRLAVSV